ncbi:MAG: metallophosphoesterase [Magnetococcus sp. DMHC-6]
MGEKLAHQIQKIITQQKIPIPLSLVITTGDIADTADPVEYLVAKDFFDALYTKSNLETKYAVFMPGNHDVSFSECQSVHKLAKYKNFEPQQLIDEQEKRKFKNYNEFIKNFHNSTDDIPRKALKNGSFLYNFPDLGLAVMALNSNEEISHLTEKSAGLISETQFQAVLEAWPKEGITLLALHHNPISAPDFQRKRLENIIEQKKPTLLLHGHQHSNNSKVSWSNCPILSIGSLSARGEKLPSDEQNTCQLILLHPRLQSKNYRYPLVYDYPAKISKKSNHKKNCSSKIFSRL